MTLDKLIQIECNNTRNINKFCTQYNSSNIIQCGYLQDNGECFKNLGLPKVNAFVYVKNILIKYNKK